MLRRKAKSVRIAEDVPLVKTRKASEDDLGSLLLWRNQDEVRDKFFERHVITEQEHLKWWNSVRDGNSKEVWIVETIDSIPIGVITFYNIERTSRSCWWSAYTTPDVPQGIRSKIQAWIILEEQAVSLAQTELNACYLLCETLIRNNVVVEMHKRFGFSVSRIESRSFEDRCEDVVVMSRKVGKDIRGMILGSDNWDTAATIWEESWWDWTNSDLEMVRTEFGQYKQLLLDEENDIFGNLDFIVLCERLTGLIGEEKILSGAVEQDLEIAVSEYVEYIKILRTRSDARLYVCQLCNEARDITIGFSEYAKGVEWTTQINRMLEERLKGIRGVEILCLERVIRKIGIDGAEPGKYWLLARVPYSQEALYLIGKEVAAIEIVKRGRQVRCLVVDLDNTLWGGVLGEDGQSGLSLSHDYPGNVYRLTQEALKVLKMRGIVLAVCSKNDESNALKAIDTHPGMILKKEDFVGFKINWGSKSKNIDSLAEELGLGLDSFAFLDDSAHERAEVKKLCPRVLVIDWKSDRYSLCRDMLEHPRMQALNLTKEDVYRTELYRREETIRRISRKVSAREDYIRELEIKIELQDVSNEPTERTIQLISKTNQFNMTGERLGYEGIEKIASSGTRVYNIVSSDRFIQRETVGVIFLSRENDEAIINNFVLSCRILGRDIEDAILYRVIEYCKTQDGRVSKIIGMFNVLERNKVARGLYKRHNFMEKEGRYELMLEESYGTKGYDHICIDSSELQW